MCVRSARSRATTAEQGVVLTAVPVCITIVVVCGGRARSSFSTETPWHPGRYALNSTGPLGRWAVSAGKAIAVSAGGALRPTLLRATDYCQPYFLLGRVQAAYSETFNLSWQPIPKPSFQPTFGFLGALKTMRGIATHKLRGCYHYWTAPRLQLRR